MEQSDSAEGLSYEQRLELRRIFVDPATSVLQVQALSGATYCVTFAPKLALSSESVGTSNPGDPPNHYIFREACTVEYECDGDEWVEWPVVQVGFSVETGCLVIVVDPASAEQWSQNQMTTSLITDISDVQRVAPDDD